MRNIQFIRMLFLVLSIASPLLPIFIGIKKKVFNIIWWYVLVDFSFEITLTIVKNLHQNFHWIGNASFFVEFLFISFFYKKLIFGRDIIFYSITFLTSIIIILSTYVEYFDELNSIGICISYAIYIFYATIYLYQKLRTLEYTRITDSSNFWVSIAILFYAGGDFFLFLFKENMIKNDLQAFMLLWSFSFLSFNILKNILLGVAMNKSYKYEN